MMRLRALFVTCHLPWPPYSGGRRREYELLRRLGPDLDLDLVCVSKTVDEDLVHTHALRDICRRTRVFPAPPTVAPPGAPCGRVIGAAHSVNTQLPWQVRRHASTEARTAIARGLVSDRYDLVHVEGVYLLPLLPPGLSVPLVVGTQNVEYELWAQRIAHATDPAERARYERELECARTFELDTWSSADVVITVTDEDRDHIRAEQPVVPVVTVPDGADHVPSIGDTPTHDGTTPSHVVAGDVPVLVLPGNFAYEPNVDAATYLCTDILPRVHDRVPRAEVLLVGNAPPPQLRALARDPRVHVLGRVPSLRPFLDRADIVVVPLRTGGGVKVKVLEAITAHRPLVTTSVGVQGLAQAARAGVEIRDSAVEFADAVVSLLLDDVARRRLARRAAIAAKTLPTWNDAARQLHGCYVDVVPGQGAAPVR